MRVRVKVPPSKVAIKLDTPEGSTYGQLRTAFALEVPGAGPAAGVLLSLNNKDPLDGGDDTPLRELGVCSGDTLWLVSPSVAAQAPVAAAAPESQPAEPAVKRAREGIVGTTQQLPQQNRQTPVAAAAEDKGKQQASAQEEATEAMAVDEAAPEEEGAVAGPALLPPSQRLPTYLLRTLQQSCTPSSSPAEVVLLAAHAAMLETGFKPCWANEGQAAGAHSGASSGASSSTACSPFQMPTFARASTSISRVHYHLVAASNGSNGMDEEAAGASKQQQKERQEQQPPTCMLQCSSMGGGGVVLAVSTQRHTRHLSLHASSFIGHLAGGAGPSSSSSSSGGAAISSQTVQLLPSGGLVVGRHLQLEAVAAKQLWTRLKDGLAFPMLLAAYAEAGLPPPVGLLALPEEIKQRVLTALGPQDLAALCGACSELRHLASQDELWRPLFEREFPHAPSYFTTQAQQRGFKWAFGQCWRERRQREEALRRARNRMFAPGVPRFGVPRPPFYPAPHPGFPLMVGGDYDRLPQFGPGSGLPGQFGGGGTAPGGIFFGGGGRRQGRGSFRMH